MRQLPPAPDLRTVFDSPLGQTMFRTQTTTNLQLLARYTCLRFHQAHSILKSWYDTEANRTDSKLKTMKNRLQGAHGFVIPNAKQRVAVTMMKTLKRHATVIPLSFEQKTAPNILRYQQPVMLKMDGWNCILSPKVASRLM